MMQAPWEKVARAGELAPGQMKRITPGGKQLLLCNAGGRLHAVDEMCSHEDYSLFLGCIQDGKIKCSLHGSYFDLDTGEPTVEPAREPICTYPVEIVDGEVWVNPERTPAR